MKTQHLHKNWLWVVLCAVLTVSFLASCTTPTPQIIEKTVEVEKVVEKTVEVQVEKTVEIAVEKVVEVEVPEGRTEPPMLKTLVDAGKLPPVEERLPIAGTDKNFGIVVQ